DETDPLAAARARTMAALAALRDGDRTHAIAGGPDGARARPLPWPGRGGGAGKGNHGAGPPLYAVMRQESGFDPEVISPARAVGLLQLLPETARTMARETPDPDDDGTRLTSPP